jgi:TrmH family RNA methyltransferase
MTDPAAVALLADLHQSAPAELEFVELTPRVMTKVSYRAQPAGLLVLAEQTRRQLTDLKLSAVPLLIVLVGIKKPGNLGAILRAADGAGADAVISSAPGPDPSNPNVLRASRGTCFTLPLATAPQPEIETFLGAHSIRRIATTPDAELDFTACDLAGPAAIILGAEDRGLDSRWLSEADQTVRIPMQGHADSLNVATTAALMLYEAVRQRRS